MLLLIQGKLHEAAAMYARAGAQDQAIAMYRDVRMFRHDHMGMLSLVMLAMHSIVELQSDQSGLCKCSEADAFARQHAAAMQQQGDERQLAELSSLMQVRQFHIILESQNLSRVLKCKC